MNYLDNQPITWWGRLPVYATTILVAVMAGGVVLTTILIASKSALLSWLGFSMPLMRPWSLWQCLTYPLVDPPSFFTPFSLMWNYSFGIQVEQVLGRQKFLSFVLLLVVVAPVIYLALYLAGMGPGAIGGGYLVLVGMVVGVATLYPTLEYWGWVPMKWIAFACLICASLMDISNQNARGLFPLWGTALAAFLFIRHHQGLGPLAAYSEWRAARSSGFKIVPRTGFPTLTTRKPKGTSQPVEVTVDPRAEVDEILDKISREGIGSLTEAERRKLDLASRRMKGTKA